MRAERVGYVLKVFPRLSETFVVTELLAHQRAGLALEVFSLRPSPDRGVHAEHAELDAAVTYLRNEGISVGVVLDSLRTAAAIGDVAALIESSRSQHPRELVQAIELAAAVRERGITHLHAHFATVAATVARLAAQLAGVTYSVTAHAKDIFHEDVTDEHLERELAGAASVITVSDFNVDHLRSRVPAAHVQRVYNGLPLERFPYEPPRPRPPAVVGVGRLVEKKGFGDLVTACSLLAREGRDFTCTIVGGGALEGELRDLVARLGIEDRVTLTGPRGQDEVRAAVRGAAVLAAPCVVGSDGNRDGLPTVLLEAMALGTPCVSTDVTGIPEVLVDGETGLMVPQGDPASLAAAIARLLDDADLRVSLAAGARRLVEERFDVDRNAAQWRDVVLGAGVPA